MIEKIDGFVVRCDICGVEYEYDGVVPVFSTEKEAHEIACSNGWVEYEPGEWACDNCVEERNISK